MPDILDILFSVDSRCRVHAYVWRKIESTCPFGRVVRRLSEMLLRYDHINSRLFWFFVEEWANYVKIRQFFFM